MKKTVKLQIVLDVDFELNEQISHPIAALNYLDHYFSMYAKTMTDFKTLRVNNVHFQPQQETLPGVRS